MASEPVHKRIDEGLIRGPRKKPGPKPYSVRRQNGKLIPKLSNDPDDIRKALEQYCVSGLTLQQIGDQYGVTKQAIYGWLLGELGGDQHAALVTRALTARIAKGDETLDTADNALDLQRGREQARNARLDLERRRSSLYGQKQEVTHTVQPVLHIHTAPQLTVADPASCAAPIASLPIKDADIVSK